jgi:hypothetical protein
MNPDYIRRIGNRINAGSTPSNNGITAHGTSDHTWYPTGMTGTNLGYKVFANVPFDAREFVETYDDLMTWHIQNQGFPYIGMSVLVLFKTNHPQEGSIYDPANLLMKRYILTTLEGTVVPGSGEEIENAECTGAWFAANAPDFFANSGNGSTGSPWAQYPTAGRAGYFKFSPDAWVPEKAEADGLGDGILVLPADADYFTYQKQTNLDGSVTYFQVDTNTGARKEILRADEVEDEHGWISLTVPVYDPVTGIATGFTPYDYCEKHEMDEENVDDLRAAAFELILQLAAPKFDLEANDDSPKTTLLTINRQATDEEGKQVTIQERVIVKGTIDVQNKVFQRTANGTYVDHDGNVAENDDTKYIRVAEGIKNGKDIISPVYEIARVGGKPINVGISLEWAEWEESGSNVQSRNAEVEGSQQGSYIDNQNGDARNAGSGTAGMQSADGKYLYNL